MRRLYAITVCAVLACLTNGTGFGQTGTVNGMCSLPGTADWSGISVTIEGTNRSALTNTAGSFSFTGVASGVVKLRAGKLLYSDTLATFVLIPGGTSFLTLALTTSIPDTFEGVKNSVLSTASTNSGNIGLPNVASTAADSGFRWGGVQQLAEGAFMISVSATRVSDAARTIFGINQDFLDHDFQSRSGVVTLTNGPDSTVHLTAYDDSRSAEPPGSPTQPIGVTVTQRTSVYGGANNGYVLIWQTIHNDTRFTLDNLTAGWFLDWNAGGQASNRGAVATRSVVIPGFNNGAPFTSEIAYQQKSAGTGPYLGVVPLSQSMFRAVRIASVKNEIAASAANGGMTEANKYLYMTQRRSDATRDTDPGSAEDLAMIVSVGGFSTFDFGTSAFAPGPSENTVVGFALVAGNSLDELYANALSAQSKWLAQGHEMIIYPAAYSYASGWRLVSAPLHSADLSVPTLFPSAVSRAFKFQTSYIAVDTLIPGMGYWVKFPADTTVVLRGAVSSAETVSVVPGWNIIGVPTYESLKADLAADPADNIISNVYGYTSGYVSVTALEPGQGYWVKCRGAGTIVIRSGK